MDLYAVFPGLAVVINHPFEILVVILLISANLLLLGLSYKAKRIVKGIGSTNHDLFQIQVHLDAIARDQRLAQAGLLHSNSDTTRTPGHLTADGFPV